ncbi:serine/threonine-protein kinase CTR1-like [Branchiostoma floridae]|uniref:Serine/threonine-protein kinase CTR1-like n=1 Tax=Branchiostoma floridae TaxID=7739 RepID=A0A9J7HVA2_BRAFL|nr:serine/threonine-protein kinase CTR1-like [Branchiostoma floridae]
MAETSRYDLFLRISQNLNDTECRDLRNYVGNNQLLPTRGLKDMDPQEIFVKLEHGGKLNKGDLSLLVTLMTKIKRADFAKEAKKIAAQERKDSEPMVTDRLPEDEEMQENIHTSDSATQDQEASGITFIGLPPDDDIPFILSKDITVKEEIGKGSFSTVYLANYKGRQVAIRKQEYEDYPWRLPEPARVLRESVLEEAAIMQQVQAENVVRLIGVCLEPANYTIVMEYMPGGSLLNLLLSDTRLAWKQLLQFSTDAARGLCALHHPRRYCPQRVHGNLTTSKFLIDANMRVKLTGFCNTKTTTSVTRYSRFRRGRSTIAFVAPENLRDINAGLTVAAEVFR